MNNSITVHEWSINWKWDYSWFFKFRNYSWSYKFMNLRTFKNMLFMNNHTLSWTVCSCYHEQYVHEGFLVHEFVHVCWWIIPEIKKKSWIVPLQFMNHSWIVWRMFMNIQWIIHELSKTEICSESINEQFQYTMDFLHSIFINF